LSKLIRVFFQQEGCFSRGLLVEAKINFIH